jgi:hypothetical protein
MTRRICRTALAVAAAIAGVSAAHAQTAGDPIEGVIASCDARRVVVTQTKGGDVTARLGNRTHVVVQSREGGHFPDASAEFLKPGMGVRFLYGTGVLDRIQVTSVPTRAWPEGGEHGDRAPRRVPPALGDGTLAGSATSGRVVDVNRRQGMITIEVDGRDETFSVEDRRLLQSRQNGDRVRFRFEERRGGRKVITAVDARPE